MLNINGLCRITSIKEVSDKCLSASLFYSNKRKDGSYMDAIFINALIVGDAVTSLINGGIKNKDYVEIEGNLSSSEYKGNVNMQAYITQIKLAPKKEDEKVETTKGKFDR